MNVSYEAQAYVGGETPAEYASRLERKAAVNEAIAKFNDPIDKGIIDFLMGKLTLTKVSKKHHIPMSNLYRRKEKVVKELQILLKNYK